MNRTMTKTEAIKWLSNLKMDIGKPQYQELWHYEQALDEIIQALEQEPNEDCISMQAAIDVVRQYCIDNQIEDGDYHANGIKYELKELPSAQPEPKTGHWIGIDDYPHEDWECNNCGYVIEAFENPNDFRYCPNCGADMRGDEE